MPLIRGEQLTRPPVYGEQTRGQESPYVPRYRGVHPESKKYMVITQDGYKLIYNRNYTTFELFDLNRDPKEQHNLYDREPEKAEAYEANDRQVRRRRHGQQADRRRRV